jgi:hypothetical protein
MITGARRARGSYWTFKKSVTGSAHEVVQPGSPWLDFYVPPAGDSEALPECRRERTLRVRPELAVKGGFPVSRYALPSTLPPRARQVPREHPDRCRAVIHMACPR